MASPDFNTATTSNGQSALAPPGQQAQQAQNTATTNQQNVLSGVLAPQYANNEAQAALQNKGLSQELAAGQAQQGITDTGLYQNYQNTLASLGLSNEQLGIQGTGLAQQGAYNTATQALQGQQNQLSSGELTEALQNLGTNYGLQVQGYNQGVANAYTGYNQGLQAQQTSGAGAGTYGTGSEVRAEGNLGTSLQQTLAALNLTGQQDWAAYTQGAQGNQNSVAQLGLTEQGEAASNTYTNQQLQNSLASLGISKQQNALSGTQAGQQYQLGTQSAANTYANLAAQTGLQQQANASAVPSENAAVLSQLLSAGGYTG